MEGLILVNGTKGLLVNCAEVYGRQPTLDAHHERTYQKRNQPLFSTLPGLDAKYVNVQLFAIDNDNSKKLELGTKTMNALFTSTVRLDKDSSVAIGPSSLNGFSVSATTTIFVRKEFLLWYKSLVDNGCKKLVVQSLYSFDELSQLRQVRSKFNKTSTYLLSRSSSAFTNDICHRPTTIWTLADQDSNTTTDSDGKNASMLFQAIAVAVWDDGDDARLDGNVVARLVQKCKVGGKVWGLMNAITMLEESKSMSVIGNDDLNRLLVPLADLLSPYILHSNTKITSAVTQRFAR
ncbi:hypothetical protein [Absidia glauca]|uniref:Uncharacterized protein n=1 Tax=Absidia glauca TaxID=4829 RepID=A0A168L380_ABSGL|nr:hypothetical protein [Absidia glauca]